MFMMNIFVKILHFFDIGVVVVIDGLLYVMGNTDSTNMLTIQIYNPNTNTWKLIESCINDAGFLYDAVNIERPPYLKTDEHECSHG